MIEIAGIVARQVDVVAEIVPSVRTYDVTTSDMSDDCLSHSIAQQAAMWLTQEGLLAEIECIYPDRVESAACRLASGVPVVIGSPILRPRGEGPLWVESHNTSFTIWLAAGKVVDQEIVMASNLKLLASESQLVGIAATNARFTLYGPE